MDHGQIIIRVYVRGLDKNGIYQISGANYAVETNDATNLKRTFTQLKEHMKSKILLNI